MYIRNAVGDGYLMDNVFEAVEDELGVLGVCRVRAMDVEGLFDDRQLEIVIGVTGSDEAQDRLLAAGMARAMLIASQHKARGKARIYAECPADDEGLFSRLLDLGFQDDDALIRMRRRASPGPISVPLPSGCAPDVDFLEDDAARSGFLDRTQRVFQRENAREWLEACQRNPMFARLTISFGETLAGEAVVWADRASRTGVVGQIYTIPKWREKGVATYLLEMARRYFSETRMNSGFASATRFSPDRPQDDAPAEIIADVRLAMRPATRLFSGAGYRRAETILRLPGIEL